MTQKEFYKSQAWRRARQSYIDYRLMIDGGICEQCHMALAKIVHHTVWLNDINCNNPDIALNPRLFKYECEACHNKEKNPAAAGAGRIAYGPNGEIFKQGDY